MSCLGRGNGAFSAVQALVALAFAARTHQLAMRHAEIEAAQPHTNSLYPLHGCVRASDDVWALKGVLHMNPDVNALDNCGHAAVWYCCQYGTFESFSESHVQQQLTLPRSQDGHAV